MTFFFLRVKYTILFVDSCDDPAPLYGYTSPSSTLNGHYSVGSNVYFFCEPGFQMNGNPHSICQQDLTWSPQPPSFCYPSKRICFTIN